VALQVASGLVCLHSHQIVHMDLKPANILLSKPAGTAKIADVGFGRMLRSSHVSSLEGRLGTYDWWVRPLFPCVGLYRLLWVWLQGLAGPAANHGWVERAEEGGRGSLQDSWSECPPPPHHHCHHRSPFSAAGAPLRFCWEAEPASSQMSTALAWSSGRSAQVRTGPPGRRLACTQELGVGVVENNLGGQRARHACLPANP
jgi:serine/threonine protein kinase